ncbi:MinD/ParA family ATP-binding protein [Glaciibacter psychrotolerans]|uniref:MinD-like ATPase involved in chromosome partitioning or flagellar assembly n=1 Tax=Glaciibacter psychrotolerans TaxID=670054 RepID=A0A7Z0J5D9_9MICO|nr:MinD/ParA family protein [Leifsonia psychrotolerans]NYJ18799.1 MinD-like ATPase involved in chromosome partitioning or flagellar assembly [Leifsonia psychrotolerans]
MSEKRTDEGTSGESVATEPDAPSASEPGDEYHSELPPHTFVNLAAALPDSLSVALPAEPVSSRSRAVESLRERGSGATSAGSPSTHTVEISTPTVARSERSTRSTHVPVDAFGASESQASPARRSHSGAGGAPEAASMLTSDRLLNVTRKTRKAPRGGWNQFVYAVTLHLVNLGDSAKVRAADEMAARIRKQFEGGARFVPVLTRKGGVGKTTVTALLGMALADAREDRVIAIDANPDRGTLSERVSKQTRSTVRDVVVKAASIGGFTDFSALVSRDETRLDILASDTDPLLSEAFDENDYNVVADLAARFYSIVLTDCGTGIVHSVMRATLQRADSIVIVSGGSVDEARLASETLTWLEANGYGALVSNAIVALNTATQGTNLVKLEEIESHFRSRVREIVRIPYDPQLAAGSVVSYKDLQPITQLASRTLAALVVEGLPATRAV